MRLQINFDKLITNSERKFHFNSEKCNSIEKSAFKILSKNLSETVVINKNKLPIIINSTRTVISIQK